MCTKMQLLERAAKGFLGTDESLIIAQLRTALRQMRGLNEQEIELLISAMLYGLRNKELIQS